MKRNKRNERSFPASLHSLCSQSLFSQEEQKVQKGMKERLECFSSRKLDQQQMVQYNISCRKRDKEYPGKQQVSEICQRHKLQKQLQTTNQYNDDDNDRKTASRSLILLSSYRHNVSVTRHSTRQTHEYTLNMRKRGNHMWE